MGSDSGEFLTIIAASFDIDFTCFLYAFFKHPSKLISHSLQTFFNIKFTKAQSVVCSGKRRSNEFRFLRIFACFQ